MTPTDPNPSELWLPPQTGPGRAHGPSNPPVTAASGGPALRFFVSWALVAGGGVLSVVGVLMLRVMVVPALVGALAVAVVCRNALRLNPLGCAAGLVGPLLYVWALAWRGAEQVCTVRPDGLNSCSPNWSPLPTALAAGVLVGFALWIAATRDLGGPPR